MSLAVFSKFEGPDFVAFGACGLAGYFAGTLAPAGSGAAIYIAILVSYHLFLGWLIFLSNGHKDAGVSLPVLHTVATHAACLFVIFGPVIAAVHTIPHFGVSDDHSMEGVQAADRTYRMIQALCCSIAGFAMFERNWLFSNEGPVVEKQKTVEVPVAPVVMQSTAEDFQAWQQYLAQQKKGPRPLGSSLKTEYEQWLLARQHARSAQDISDGQPRA
jgi:hypothetical protein